MQGEAEVAVVVVGQFWGILVWDGAANWGEGGWIRSEIRRLEQNDGLAHGISIEYCKGETYEGPAEVIVYIIHRPSEIMQLRPRLTTTLQFPLQPTQNMIERQPVVARALTLPLPIPSIHPNASSCKSGLLTLLLLPICANENKVPPLTFEG
jgi:hypothetical protein